MSAEGRARRQSAGARGGAGAEAAAREHPRGSEPRQPASPAPQRERPRRLAHHLPPQCPRPSRGRAWTRLSKCGAPATHDVHGLAPRGGRVARAAGEKAPGARPQRALASLCLARGSRVLSGDSGDTGRGAGRRAAGGRKRGSTRRRCGPLPATWDAPQSHCGPESLHRSRQRGRSEARRCNPESLQDSILLLSPLSFLLGPLSLCPFGSGKGDITSGGLPSPRRPPSRSAGGAAARSARDRRVRRCENSPRSSLRPPETLEQLNPELIWIHVPASPPGVHRWGPLNLES